MARLILLVLAALGIAAILYVVFSGDGSGLPITPSRPDAGTVAPSATGELPPLPGDAPKPETATGSLLILATDEGGGPIPGVEVLVRIHPPQRGETDGKGRAVFTDLPARTTFWIRVGGNGYHRSEDRIVELEADQELEERFVISTGGRIRGRVVTAAGTAPEVALLISLVRDPGRFRYATRIDSTEEGIVVPAGTGVFDIGGVVPGACVLVVKAPGFTPSKSAVIEVRVGETVTGVELVLARGGSVSGVVLDPDGNPVAKAMVGHGGPRARFEIGRHEYSWEGRARQATVTDDQGRFRFKGVPPGEIGMAAAAEGFAPGRVRNLAVKADEETAGVVISLLRGGALTGTVRGTDGNPIALAEILVARVWPGVKTQGEIGRRITANQDGVYRVSPLEPGRYKVRHAPDGNLSRGGFVMETSGEDTAEDEDDPGMVTVVEGRITVKDLEASSLAAVAGTVRSTDGRPLRKAVSLFKLDEEGRRIERRLEMPVFTLAREDGGYRLSDIEPGDYLLTAGSYEEKLSLVAGETRRVEISVPVFDISGVVVDCDGKPVAGAKIYAQQHDQHMGITLGSIEEIRSDASGTFTIRDLDPGDFTIAAHTEEAMGTSRKFVLGPGKSPFDLRVVVRGLVRLRVKLVDAEGKPLAERFVVLSREDGNGHAEPTDASGAATFRIVPGKYEVEVYGETGEVSPKEITLGTEAREVTLTLR